MRVSSFSNAGLRSDWTGHSDNLSVANILISQTRYVLATKQLPLYNWVKKNTWVCVLLSANFKNLHFLKKKWQNS